MKLIWHFIIALALLAGQINLPAAPADCAACCAKPSAECCCVAPNAPDDNTQPLAPAPASVSAPQLESLLHVAVQFTPAATEPRLFASAALDFFPPASVPLFQRNCLLLI